MARSITELKKPIKRRRGSMVIEIAAEGLRVRGRGRKKWRAASWEQIFALLDPDDDPTITRAIDERVGARVMATLGADPHAEVVLTPRPACCKHPPPRPREPGDETETTGEGDATEGDPKVCSSCGRRL